MLWGLGFWVPETRNRLVQGPLVSGLRFRSWAFLNPKPFGLDVFEHEHDVGH